LKKELKKLVGIRIEPWMYDKIRIEAVRRKMTTGDLIYLAVKELKDKIKTTERKEE
jgi:hypothetical protein